MPLSALIGLTFIGLASLLACQPAIHISKFKDEKNNKSHSVYGITSGICHIINDELKREREEQKIKAEKERLTVDDFIIRHNLEGKGDRTYVDRHNYIRF